MANEKEELKDKLNEKTGADQSSIIEDEEKVDNVDNYESESKKEIDIDLEAESDKNKEEVQENSTDEEKNQSEPAFKIKQLENKIAEQEDSIKRINAEYANYRRRTAEEKSSIGIFANEKIMNELIPVIDNMQRALDACDDKESQLYKGIELVYKQLVDSLKKAGLEEIPSEIGTEFDPNMHMAVMQEASEEFEAGKILLSLQKGYKLGSKVLRASMVKVSC